MLALDTPTKLRQSPWFEEPEYDAHTSLFTLIRHLRSQSRDRHDDFWLHYRLFDRRGLQGTRFAGRRGRTGAGTRLALNVVRAASLAVHAKITQNRPRPTYLTIGGSYGARKKAQSTQAYSDGCIYHSNGYDVAAEIALHAIVLGTGTGFCYVGEDGRPKIENVLGSEIDVERTDSAGRAPSRIYRTRAVLRSQLLETYRKKGDEESLQIIEDAPLCPDELTVEQDDLSDRVAVCEAYMVGDPDNAEEVPGRHVIALENGTLVDEPWARSHPFVHIRWGNRLRGFHGYGIAEQLTDLQYEINMLLMRAQEQMALAGPKIAVARGSQILQDDLNNEIWGIIEYNGTKPDFIQYQSVDPALLEQVNTLYQRAFDEVGVSQMAVRSEKPAGLNSGKALLTYSDLESAKFVSFGQAYERLVRDMSVQFLDIAQSMEEDGPTATITYPLRKYRRRYLERVSRADIVATKDDYICQVFPTSALAQTPSAKQQQIGEMSDRGWIDAATAVRLLDFPDLDDETSLMSASVEYIDMLIDEMLEKGVKVRPEPWINYDVAIIRCGMALQRAKIDDVPETRWSLLGYFVDACQRARNEAQQAQQAAQQPPSQPPPQPGGQGGGAAQDPAQQAAPLALPPGA